MNKTAAIRSQARRAALYKCATVDPAQVAGVVGMLGGGALAGSAATGDDRSTLKRIGKGALATGLAYGGYKAMTDPRWQQGIRDGASRLHDLFKRFAARLNGVASAGVKQAGAASAVKGLLRAAGKAKGGSGLQKALADGKIVFPPAMSTKALVHEALKGLRGPRSYGWPLPAYPFRGGRDKGLLDLLDRARFMGTASSPGGRMTTEEAIQLLRRLNGRKSVVGPQEAEALRKSIIPPKPVGVDLSGMKITKKSSVEEKGMAKTAAVRSQARRAALAKRAGALDRLAGIGARYKELLAGNSPLMGPYRWGKRAVGALSSFEDGVSPAAEQLKYMWTMLKSNSPLGSELRKVYATRAGTGIAGIAGLKALLGGSGEKKAAEAAYIDGFCKAAETLGVDPAVLYKRADARAKVLGWLGRVGGRAIRGGQAVKGGVRRGFDRFTDLLNGTTAAKYRDQVSSMDRLMGKMQGAGRDYVASGTPEARIWSRARHQRARMLRRLGDENFKVGLTRTGYLGGLATLPVLAVAGTRRAVNRHNQAHGDGQTPQAMQG